MLAVSIDGRRTTAVLDTGASAGLHLPLSEARRFGLGGKWETAEPIEARGARGTFEARKTKVGSVTINGFEFEDVETVISPSAGTRLIGNGLLAQTVLTVDYQRKRICMSRPGAGTTE